MFPFLGGYAHHIISDSLPCRGRNVPDCLPVSSDRQNVFLPVSTNIQLEQYYFDILFSLFETQLGLYNH